MKNQILIPNPTNAKTKMVITPYKHSYATQILWQNNLQLFRGKKPLLEYPFKDTHWQFSKLETKIISGQLASSIEKYKIIESYEDLISMGFIITISKVRGKFFKGQKVQYMLAKRKSFIYDVGRIPTNHRIEYDVLNKRMRLIGKNSDGKWIYSQIKREPKEYKTEFNPLNYDKYFTKYEEYMKKFMQNSGIEIEEEPIEFIIPEIPVMITEDNKLLCIPEKKDTPIIGLIGKRRTGKTMGLHGIADRIVNKWGKKGININDLQKETGTWCLSWDNLTFLKQLESIGEISQPLPIVYLHPFSNDFKSVINEVGFEISLPFKEIMIDYETFLQGKIEWQFEKSGTYFRNLIFNDNGSINESGLLNCKSYEEMKDLILMQEEKEIQEEVRGQILVKKYIGYLIENEKVRYKLLNVMKDICNTQIFNIINKVPSEWTLRFPDENRIKAYPWIACILAGLFPSIITADIRTKHYFPQWFKFICEDLLQFQKDDIFRNKQELYIFIPEIQGIKKDNIINDTLNKLVNESGLARIGVVYDTQNVERIPDDVKFNTNYIFAFNQKKEQANLIAKDFDLLGYREKELIKLKRFECIAVGEFVAYDMDGEREIISDEPIKGLILPSVSMHQAPKLTGEEE